MFGFSLAELIVVFLAALFFIKPQDLPEIAYFIGKIFYRAKKFYYEIKTQFKEMEKEIGVEDLKNELNRGIADEKLKSSDDVTVIVDMYGNEHLVPNIEEIRPDLTKEEIEEEVKKSAVESINPQQIPNKAIINT
jgi:Sec-independent protein translocase protein TatA